MNKEQSDLELSALIINWLKQHPMFSKNQLCKAIGCDTSGFGKECKRGWIAPKRLERIVTVLKDYGFQNSNGENKTITKSQKQ